MTMTTVGFSIPQPYNGGEWRISKQVTGSRGGMHYETVISQSATGGNYIIDLEEGHYKQTYWTNGWPTATEFDVTEHGVIGLGDWYV
jgi:hypothetical protein